MYSHSYGDENLGLFGIALPSIGTIIRTGVDLFGGGGGGEAPTSTGPPVSIGVLGIKVCAQGPVPWLIFKPAWDNAPQTAKDELWARYPSYAMSDAGVRGMIGNDPKTSDDVRAGLICMKANGSNDCKINSDRNRRAASDAAEFVDRWRFAPPAPDSTAKQAADGTRPPLLAGVGEASPALLLGGAALAAYLLTRG